MWGKTDRALRNRNKMNKILKINLTMEVNNLYTRNYKTLMEKKNEEDQLMKDIPCIWIRRINIVKMAILSKAIYRFNEICMKIELFTEIKKN